MAEKISDIIDAVRDRFEHVDTCPFQGDRVFFENAGGALTLKSVTRTSAKFAAIPDNQGRANVASQELVNVIAKSKEDIRRFFNVANGQIFVGESGTELLFRLISAACLGAETGQVLGCTFEHPATRSACIRWSKIAGHDYVSIPHNTDTGMVVANDYAAYVTPKTRVATILHTSPVTGMGVDVPAIVNEIRAISPNCFIIVDGIQHAAHGQIDIDSYGIDGYVISPYKAFSRHGFGVAWISEKLTKLPHDTLVGGPSDNWELGTRDTGSYATMSDVVEYFEWLGGHMTKSDDRRDRIVAAGNAIRTQEKELTDAMLFGTGNLPGLTDLPNTYIVGGADNPAREGLVSFFIDGMDSAEIVENLSNVGFRVHIRRDDHYSGTILTPLGRKDCIRVSLCHYNSLSEVTQFLAAMKNLTD